MEKIIYNDGVKICVLESGQMKTFESDYINNYIRNSIASNSQKSWKNQGYGAKFRGETGEELRATESINTYINSAQFLSEKEILYTFTINEMSGIYKKNLALEKNSESHIIHSNELEFNSTDFSPLDNELVVGIKSDDITSHLGLVDLATNDYKTITGGDCKDENPTYSPLAPNTILYNSFGVGRDFSGNFIEYGDSEIMTINTQNNQINKAYGEQGFSCVKPKQDKNGNLFFIRRPTKYKKKQGNLFLDILLIPVKILLAIFNFIETFVMMFTGKTFTSKDNNPTKGREQNSQKIFIDGNLINIEQEYKLNSKNKDKLAGFIPNNWQLCKLDKDGVVTVLKKGISSFDILEDNSIICSNGRNILKISEKLSGKTNEVLKDGSKEKTSKDKKKQKSKEPLEEKEKFETEKLASAALAVWVKGSTNTPLKKDDVFSF